MRLSRVEFLTNLCRRFSIVIIDLLVPTMVHGLGSYGESLINNFEVMIRFESFVYLALCSGCVMSILLDGGLARVFKLFNSNLGDLRSWVLLGSSSCLNEVWSFSWKRKSFNSSLHYYFSFTWLPYIYIIFICLNSQHLIKIKINCNLFNN